MRLFEHPDFEQAILRSAEHFGDRSLRPAIIEKDYYITEALRVVAGATGDKVIFKGGTSLSKGWNLIRRFSEDVDLFFDPQAFKPPLGRRAIDRELRRLRDAVGGHPALTFVPADSRTVGGFGRSDSFSYKQRFAAPGEVAGRVLLECGTASGREPTAELPIVSYVAQFLQDSRQSLGAEDESPFAMRLLHFRRTFVEKLFTIHAKVELFKRERRPIGGYARHYYDLHQLAAEAEVIAMLRSDEYTTIRDDYDQISRVHFPKDHVCPVGMTFSASDAIFPTGALADMLAKEYEQQCRILCYGPDYPSWADVQARFAEIKSLL